MSNVLLDSTSESDKVCTDASSWQRLHTRVIVDGNEWKKWWEMSKARHQ